MNIITKDEWGAKPARRTDAVQWYSTAVVHHTADPAEAEYYTRKPGLKWFAAKYRMNRQVKQILAAYKARDARAAALEAANMRFMQGYHMAKGWADIGYHYVIYPSGRVYQGRPRNTYGAHALNGNHMPGISFGINSEIQPATAPQLDAFEALCHEINVDTVVGHRWVPGNATACPGKNLIRQLGLNSAGIARI